MDYTSKVFNREDVAAFRGVRVDRQTLNELEDPYDNP